MQRLYATYCSNCHGASGKGDGLAAKSLPVKPANHTDGNFLSQLSDKYLHDIISKGGSGVEKSPFMPAWGSLLKDQQIRSIISYMRSLSTPLTQSPQQYTPYHGPTPAAFPRGVQATTEMSGLEKEAHDRWFGVKISLDRGTPP